MRTFGQVRQGAALVALLLASCVAKNAPPAITVDDGWARASVPGQTSAAVYFTIRNSGGEDRLIAISSPAGRASLHSTSMNGGVMRMRPLDSLTIPANSTFALEPGGTHAMLTGVSHGLSAGTDFPMRLIFERSGQQWVRVSVRPASADGATM